MIDLHMHSELSIDARNTPEELVACAREKGLRAVSITEHNNLRSLERGKRKAVDLGVEYVNGIEFGGGLCVDGLSVPVHLLGYFFDDQAPHIRTLAQQIEEQLDLQAEAFLRGLEILGLPVTRAQVAAQYPGRVSGWAIRRILRHQGYAKDKPEASALMRRAVQAAKERHADLAGLEDSAEAASIITALKADGATCIVAHPFLLAQPARGGHPEDRIWRSVELLLELGADGLEAFNPSNGEYAEALLRYCRQRNLPASGGSDSHGIAKIGSMSVDDELFESIRRHRAGMPCWSHPL